MIDAKFLFWTAIGIVASMALGTLATFGIIASSGSEIPWTTVAAVSNVIGILFGVLITKIELSKRYKGD